jgi:hypothetical protein
MYLASKFDCLKHPSVLTLEEFQQTPFHWVALLLFALAVLHTLSVTPIRTLARQLELTHRPKKTHKTRHMGIQLLYFLSEVEMIFAFWAIPLFLAMCWFYNWETAINYLNTRDYTEPLFVVVILALAATRPIIQLAEGAIRSIARGLGGSLSAWWFTLLTVGPLLGSFITEVGAMVLSALLLSRQFFHFRPSRSLAYATLGLLFVNVSVGGILTDFASPAVLILAHHWGWTTWTMTTLFGWKAALGIVLSNGLYWFYFRREFALLNERFKWQQRPVEQEAPVPLWVTLIHILFIVWAVSASHYPAMFVASFLLFLGFHHATRAYQYPIHLVRPLLVGLFLAGLVIHGGLQGWWVVPLLEGLDPLGLMGVAIGLTAFNDNTAIAYLTTLVPAWGEVFKYALFTGVVAGGGLTVIGNAPNPAGFQILSKSFNHSISAWRLCIAALIPTLILYALFFFLGPVW